MLILLKIDTSTPGFSIFIKWFLIQTIKTRFIKTNNSRPSLLPASHPWPDFPFSKNFQLLLRLVETAHLLINDQYHRPLPS